MRPRLLHLGYTGTGARKRAQAAGFNEAEAFTPRIYPVLDRRGICELDFNEAEAFTPRIYRARLRILPGRPDFNEAEAFTPRISSVS